MRRIMIGGVLTASVTLGTVWAAVPSMADEPTPVAEVLGLTYDPANDLYVVVEANPGGEIDVYTGTHAAWTKLPENRDIDNRYTPEEFVDVAIGGTGSTMYGVAVGTKILDVDPRSGRANVDLQPRCTSINARAFYGKPWFGDGKPEIVAADLETCLSLTFDPSNNLYVLVGSTTDDQIDVYTGQHGAWIKLQENRDIDNRYTPDEFVGVAMGGDSIQYGVAVGNVLERCTSINARNFYNKPYFGDGAPQLVAADLAACLSVTYDPSHDLFVLVGENIGGQIDVYTGRHGAWTKLQENRDIDNRYTPTEFVDVAIGGTTAVMYGVAVGNKTVDVNPLNGASNVDLQQRGTSINARAFYGRPWFGDGAPKLISE